MTKKKKKKKNTILLKTGGLYDDRPSLLYPQMTKINSLKDEKIDTKDEEEHIIEAFSQARNNVNIQPSRCVIEPDCFSKSLWDIFIFISVVWQAVVIPYRLSLDISDINSSLYQFEVFLDICFALDILISFNTGFYRHGLLIMNRKLISLGYAKTWFCLDIFATFPYSNVLEALYHGNSNKVLSKTPQLLRLLKIFRFLRFLKLIRVLKVSKVLQKYEDILYNDNVNIIMGFVKLFVIIVFFTHILACLFCYTGSTPIKGESWLILKGLQDESKLTQYINSLYWAFTTMVTVGYGDMHAFNTNERVFVMGAMIIAVGVYAFTLNTISKKVQEYNLLASKFRGDMLYVNKWMIYNELPKDLRFEIRRYLEYQWDLKQKLKIEEASVMALLNQDLKDKIVLYMYGRYIQSITFKDEFTMEFISQLVFKMKEQTFGIGENIILEGEEGDKIYFILKGKVAVLHRETHTFLDDLYKKDYFGEIAFFTQEQRTASVKSRDFTELLNIDRESFFQLAEEYPEAQDVYHKIKLAIVEEKDYSFLKISCFICRKLGHIAIYCTHFHIRRGNLNTMVNYQRKESQKKSKKTETQKTQEEELSEGIDVQILIKRNEKNDFKLKNTLESRNNSIENASDLIEYYTLKAGGFIEETSMVTDSDYTQSLYETEQLNSNSQYNMRKQGTFRTYEEQESKQEDEQKRQIPNKFFKIANLDDDRCIRLTACAPQEEIVSTLKEEKQNNNDQQQSSDSSPENSILAKSQQVLQEENQELVNDEEIDEFQGSMHEQNVSYENQQQEQQYQEQNNDSLVQELKKHENSLFEFDKLYSQNDSQYLKNTMKGSLLAGKEKDNQNDSDSLESFNFRNSQEKTKYFQMLEEEVFNEMERELNSSLNSNANIQQIQGEIPSIDTTQENIIIREFENQFRQNEQEYVNEGDNSSQNDDQNNISNLVLDLIRKEDVTKATDQLETLIQMMNEQENSQ